MSGVFDEESIASDSSEVDSTSSFVDDDIDVTPLKYLSFDEYRAAIESLAYNATKATGLNVKLTVKHLLNDMAYVINSPTLFGDTFWLVVEVCEGYCAQAQSTDLTTAQHDVLVQTLRLLLQVVRHGKTMSQYFNYYAYEIVDASDMLIAIGEMMIRVSEPYIINLGLRVVLGGE